MDHIWYDLLRWETMWEEQLQEEKNGPEHEYKQHNVELLTNQLKSIRKAVKEIGKWV